MKNKITKTVPTNSKLMAVVKTDSGPWTHPVVALELVETSGGDQERRALVTYEGELIPAADLPGYLGLASSKGEADHLYLRSLTREEFAAFCAKETKIHKTFNWGNSRCARPADRCDALSEKCDEVLAGGTWNWNY
jgi:hypothetical protein